MNFIDLHANSPASQLTRDKVNLRAKYVIKIQLNVPVNLQAMSTRTLNRPTLRSAMANCLMKKFIRDFLLFRYKVMRTAELPNTIVAKRIHRTVNCSVYL